MTMGRAQAIDLLFAAAYDACGVGAPAFVGRNRSLSLSLSVDEVVSEGASATTLDISVETAAARTAPAWRTLGAFAQVTAVGSYSLELSGAEAFVRARYTPSAGACFGLSVTGEAVLSVLSSASRAASGVGSAVDMAQYRSARLTLAVSAVSGSLDVTIETATSATSPTWRTVTTFESVTSAVEVDGAAVDLDRYVRVRWTLSVAGSATFGVSGVSRLVLATPSDRARFGVRGGAFPSLSAEASDDFLYAASADVLGAYYERWEEPLRSWGDDTRRACIAIGDWLAIAERGTEPGRKLSPEETTFYERYCYYVGNPPGSGGWLRQAAKRAGGVTPLGIVDSTIATLAGERTRIEVASDPPRGWGGRAVRR